MTHRIRVTAVRRDRPDLERFVAVLLALALARAQAEADATKEATATDVASPKEAA